MGRLEDSNSFDLLFERVIQPSGMRGRCYYMKCRKCDKLLCPMGGYSDSTAMEWDGTIKHISECYTEAEITYMILRGQL